MSSAPRNILLSAALLRLKSANRRAVKDLGGTSLVAEELDIRQQRVSDCQLTNTPDFFRQDELLAIEEAGRGSPGWPRLTRAQARHHGFELMPLPAAAANVPSWHQSIAEVSRESGDAVAKIAEALANDGLVTAGEIRDGAIVEEIDEAIGKLVVLRGLCAVELGGDK